MPGNNKTKDVYYFPGAAIHNESQFGQRHLAERGLCDLVCVFFVSVISVGIFVLILQDLGLFHVDTGD